MMCLPFIYCSETTISNLVICLIQNVVLAVGWYTELWHNNKYMLYSHHYISLTTSERKAKPGAVSHRLFIIPVWQQAEKIGVWFYACTYLLVYRRQFSSTIIHYILNMSSFYHIHVHFITPETLLKTSQSKQVYDIVMNIIFPKHQGLSFITLKVMVLVYKNTS